ncbi:MAG TPA: bifunctional hydroxymethylpyrimidine kinase/phosphomethylpyrimidine kinase [Opitutales bacterium]|nr:bifunctional hydroxymethylpyrimidine kinase/phosphomethylpyrimidine kinase [Opitutales bacterium]
MKYKVLSIAGFDGSGGAGLQADLKTFSALGCYGMTVLTALPVQNTTGVKVCYEIPLQSITDQLKAIFEDIRPDAIKIGMLFNAPIIEAVTQYLKVHAQGIPIVLDPVMMAKSGDPLLLPEAIDCLRTKLIPLTTILTPNLPEAQALIEKPVHSRDEMPSVASALLELGPRAVLLKGGHLEGPQAADLFMDANGSIHWLESPRIVTRNTHGTGCTLSAAIAACLAQGMGLLESCRLAKRYLTQALEAASHVKIGHGSGPVHHFYHLWPAIDKIS